MEFVPDAALNSCLLQGVCPITGRLSDVQGADSPAQVVAHLLYADLEISAQGRDARPVRVGQLNTVADVDHPPLKEPPLPDRSTHPFCRGEPEQFVDLLPYLLDRVEHPLHGALERHLQRGHLQSYRSSRYN
jgi:hypothetical protein